jgi:hypothetical protein
MTKEMETAETTSFVGREPRGLLLVDDRTARGGMDTTKCCSDIEGRKEWKRSRN